MKDGLLARIRLPGGCLPSEKAILIAELSQKYGNGEIDLTNRANLQLRGIAEKDKGTLVSALLEHKLVSSDPLHDRRRNITLDPLSGLDLKESSEIADCTRFATAIDALLKTFTEREKISPKFSFVFDGGGLTNIAAQPHDLAFIALKPETDQEYADQNYVLSINGAPTPFFIPESTLVGAVELILKKLIKRAAPEMLRMKSLIKRDGRDAVIEELTELLPPEWRLENEKQPGGPANITLLRRPVEMSNGNHCMPLVAPTGRLTHSQLLALAALNQSFARGPLRLTPWQGIILTDVSPSGIDEVAKEAKALGFLTEEKELELEIISCAGSSSCIYGTFETKQTSLDIRDALSSKTLKTPLKIHLSACEKGCASRAPSDWLVMGRRGSEEVILANTAAPSKETKGTEITPESIVGELKNRLS